MPTREQTSSRIRRDLEERGVSPADPLYVFALESMEAMNQGMADLDDELADLVCRLEWLAQAPTWINQRPLGEFDAFVVAKLIECDRWLARVRERWEHHQGESQRVRGESPPPT